MEIQRNEGLDVVDKGGSTICGSSLYKMTQNPKDIFVEKQEARAKGSLQGDKAKSGRQRCKV